MKNYLRLKLMEFNFERGGPPLKYMEDLLLNTQIKYPNNLALLEEIDSFIMMDLLYDDNVYCKSLNQVIHMIKCLANIPSSYLAVPVGLDPPKRIYEFTPKSEPKMAFTLSDKIITGIRYNDPVRTIRGTMHSKFILEHPKHTSVLNVEEIDRIKPIYVCEGELW